MDVCIDEVDDDIEAELVCVVRGEVLRLEEAENVTNDDKDL